MSAVISKDGNQRAHFLIKELINKAYREGANIPYTQNTPYINTIPPEAEVKSNGDQNIERRIRSLIRWNAAAMVVRANKKFPELGGHIGTFASAATLYDVGMNHFWRAKNNKFGGVSLLPFLESLEKIPHKELFWKTGYVKSIISENFKLHINEKEDFIFLNKIDEDPSEKSNLISIYPQKAKELKEKWNIWNKTLKKSKWKSNADVSIPLSNSKDSKKYYFPW